MRQSVNGFAFTFDHFLKPFNESQHVRARQQETSLMPYRLALQQVVARLGERVKFVLNNIPKDGQVNSEILVGQDIS